MPIDGLTLAGPLADRDAWVGADCPLAAALSVIGTRSTLLLLREAVYGTRRFQDFARRVGISEAVAAARLKELTADGLLERVPYRDAGSRTRHEYSLTRKGEELIVPLAALMDWGDRWVVGGDGIPAELRHHDCGAPVRAELRCADGHRLDHADELELALRRPVSFERDAAATT